MFRNRLASTNARLAFVQILTVSFLVFCSTSQAGVFDGRPDALVCSVDDPSDVQPWDQIVFYASAHLEDGGVLYKSLTSNPVLVIVSREGRIAARNLADCDGKTIAELRDAGRAFNFSKSL